MSKHKILLIIVAFLMFTATSVYAIDSILFKPQSPAPTCDASQRGLVYYDDSNNSPYYCDGSPTPVSMSGVSLSTNLSVATVTTTDGAIYLNDQGQEGDIYQVDQIFGLNDLRLAGDSDFTGEADQYSDIYITATGDVTITNGSLTVTELGDCNQVNTTAGLLGCGTDLTDDDVSSSELDNLCATDNKILKRLSGTWSCADQATGGATITGSPSAGQVAFFNSGSTITGNANLFWDSSENQLRFGGVGADSGYAIVTTAGGIKAESNTSDPAAYFSHTASGYALITGSGNVGIATNAPGAELEVYGDVIAGSDGGNLWVGATNNRMRIDTDANSGYLNYESGTRAIDFDEDETWIHGTDMYINPSGNVGVGLTPSGNYRLTIKETTSNSGYGMRIVNAAGDKSAQIWVGTGGAVLDAEGSTNLHLRTAGADRLFISNSGNVGVGTTSLGKKFTVVGDIISVDGSGSGVNSIAITGSGTGGSIWANNSYNPASPGSGWAEMIKLEQDTGYVILPSGRRLGVGATSPAQTLDVNGNIISSASGTRDNRYVMISRGSEGRDRALVGYYSGGTANWFVGMSYNCGGFTPNFYISQKNYLNSCSASYTPEVTIDTSGNVGIGTSNPSDKLHVRSSNSLRALVETAGSGYAGLRAKNSVRDYFVGVNGSTGRFDIWDNSAGAARLTVSTGGNVGIGNTGPSYKLDVSGTGRLTGDLIYNGNLKTNSATIQYRHTVRTIGANTYDEVYYTLGEGVYVVTCYVYLASGDETQNARIDCGSLDKIEFSEEVSMKNWGTGRSARPLALVVIEPGSTERVGVGINNMDSQQQDYDIWLSIQQI